MHRLLSMMLLAAVVMLIPTASPADTPEPAAETPATETAPAPEITIDQTLTTLLASATEDQRARTLRFIRNRYPDLTTELLALLQSHHPGIFVDLDGEIENLIATRYPRLSSEVQRMLQRTISERHPQVRQEIAELIAEGYPELINAMNEAGEGDAGTRTSRLIRDKHRQVLDDVLNLLRNRHPTLLVDVRREILVKTPGLIVDVALVVAKKYPDLSLKVTLTLAEKYPELIPGILKILAPVPEAEVTGE